MEKKVLNINNHFFTYILDDNKVIRYIKDEYIDSKLNMLITCEYGDSYLNNDALKLFGNISNSNLFIEKTILKDINTNNDKSIIRLIDKDNNIINEVYFINDKININKNDNSLNNYHVPIDIKNLYGMNLSINKNNIKK